MTFQELLELPVSSVSRVEENWFTAAAAVKTITSDEIRRSGLTHVPELLRLVPGVHVARVNANRWAISTRGFNSFYSSKLLVMIDGRSVYTPFFAGVYWDVQDVVLEDVERIEVIRGPGASVWGANAVNGVINIITKHSGDTQGLLVEAGGGSEEHAFGTARYGGTLREDLHYRTYFKFTKTDDFVDARGARSRDGWRMSRAGLRADWSPTSRDDLTLQGDGYGGSLDETRVLFDPAATGASPPGSVSADTTTDVRGGNAIVRWKRRWTENSRHSLQIYYDRTGRDEITLSETRDTFDVDFQHVFDGLGWSRLVWGLGYRYNGDETEPTQTLMLAPESRSDHLYQGFAQLEARLLDDGLRLTLGVRAEHNDYSGWEAQPTARAAWLPADWLTLWGSVSRAIRSPARSDHDMRVNQFLAGPTVFANLGNRMVNSERVYAFECGVRARLLGSVLVDVAAFYNDYDRLMSFAPGSVRTDLPPPVPVRPLDQGNDSEARTAGVEILTEWQALPEWQLTAGYTFLWMDFTNTRPGVVPVDAREKSPEHQLSLRSQWNPLEPLEFDLLGLYVSSLDLSRANSRWIDVDSYFRLDARVGWHAMDWLELSVVGQDLIESHHAEWSSGTGFVASRPQRAVYGKATFRF